MVFLITLGCSKTPNSEPNPPPTQTTISTNLSSLSLTGTLNASDSFNLVSNGAWTITFSPSTPSWLGLNILNGTGNKKIIVSILEANNTGSDRSTVLNIVASSGTSTATVTVLQRINETLTINNLIPDHGPAYTLVTINGTGFNPNPALDSVFFNGRYATIVSASPTSIVAKVPVGAGSGNVSVKVNNNIAVGQLFTYELSWVATVIAGTGYAGTTNGIGTSAAFATPTGLTIDTFGNIYVADLGGYTIRKITTQAVVTTFAGQPLVQGNQNGTGTGALFSYVNDVVANKAGNVFAADFVNNNIRMITPAGVVTTYIAFLWGPTGIAVDDQNYIYVASPSFDNIHKISPSGVTTQLGAGNGFNEIYDVTVDAQGNMFVCDRSLHMIKKIDPSGVVTDIAGVWHVAGMNNGPGNTATFNRPSSIAVDNNGNIYIADVGNNAIRKINSSGIVSTYLANVSSYTTDASFFGPYGVAVDMNGIVYVSNTSENKILKITEQ